MYWLIFWFHIVILYKISFHLIGHTIWFYIEIRFSYFEPPLLFCNGDSKNENFNSLQKYRVRPIKWKGILHRLTIWSQKIGQYNSVESSLKMGLIFFHFEDYSKSARWMISFWLVTCYHTPTLHNNAEKPTVIWFFTQILIESTVCNSGINLVKLIIIFHRKIWLKRIFLISCSNPPALLGQLQDKSGTTEGQQRLVFQCSGTCLWQSRHAERSTHK